MTKFYKALSFLLDNINVRFEKNEVKGISMGTNCAPLVADLFLFSYERDFMLSLSPDKQPDILQAFNGTSRNLDDILNVNDPYFHQMVSKIYLKELVLDKTNSSDTNSSFLDLNISISDVIFISKIYDKMDDFNFNIVNFPQFDGDVPRTSSYGVYISQLIRFARACSHVDDFNERNLYTYIIIIYNNVQVKC